MRTRGLILRALRAGTRGSRRTEHARGRDGPPGSRIHAHRRRRRPLARPHGARRRGRVRTAVRIRLGRDEGGAGRALDGRRGGREGGAARTRTSHARRRGHRRRRGNRVGVRPGRRHAKRSRREAPRVRVNRGRRRVVRSSRPDDVEPRVRASLDAVHGGAVDWRHLGRIRVEGGRVEDVEVLGGMVRRHERTILIRAVRKALGVGGSRQAGRRADGGADAGEVSGGAVPERGARGARGRAGEVRGGGAGVRRSIRRGRL
mmetsp:Transcript_4998/g.22300  ORF Transcript_4998/g.22300 Transcript_4998/m.22300 type:complete len:260 (-) Transcript_4998:53-832(-)